LKYLLDTNVCIALIKERPVSVRTSFNRAVSEGSEFYTSSVVIFELWYGVSKSQLREANTLALVAFLSGLIQQLAFDEEDARLAGELRAEMETIGRPVGDYDLLIAGQALRHKMTLVTANTREFGRIKTLSWEDWSRS
jgi:tRNA(fMet)-specific endonuclease VapC